MLSWLWVCACRVAWVRALVTRAAEACFLLSTLSKHHMPRLTSRLDDTARARLQPLKLRDLVCTSEGEGVAAQLISVLVTEHLTATGEYYLQKPLPFSHPKSPCLGRHRYKSSVTTHR